MAGRKLPVLPVLATFPESGDLLYVVDISDTSESPQGTSKQMERETLLDAGTFTLSPVVTTGTGTSTDFTFDYIKVGSKAMLTLFSEVLEIAIGEQALKVEIDLTGTPAEPAANFIGPYSLTGSINQYDVQLGSASIVLAGAAVFSVDGTKKIIVLLATDAVVSGSPYQATVGGSITITI